MIPSCIVEGYKWTGELILYPWVICFRRYPGLVTFLYEAKSPLPAAANNG
jgi:hypothetical protein